MCFCIWLLLLNSIPRSFFLLLFLECVDHLLWREKVTERNTVAIGYWSSYSVPSTSGAIMSSSGLLDTIIAALHRIRPSASHWKSCRVATPLSSPACRARAGTSRLSWTTATWCRPPRVSMAMGRKTRPCSCTFLQFCSLLFHFQRIFGF